MRVWREIFAALTRMQGAFAVAVHAPDDQRDLWDIARDHYGSATPVSAMNEQTPALRAVIDGTATVAVLPWPEDKDPDPWWPALVRSEESRGGQECAGTCRTLGWPVSSKKKK